MRGARGKEHREDFRAAFLEPFLQDENGVPVAENCHLEKSLACLGWGA